MVKPEFGTDLALQLHKAERALDLAIAEVHDLASAMTRGRIQNRLAVSVGQDALQAVASLGAGLSDQRALIVTAHAMLKRDADDMGIPWQAAGPQLKPDTDRPARPAALQVVA